jgi:putative heme-binding domain-containing protein
MESHHLDSKILEAALGSDKAIAKIAKTVINQLKIQPKVEDKTPKVGALAADTVLSQVVSMKGDVSIGREVFTKANCAACHTVRQDEVQKGPYLGTIAKTYKRPELAAAILEPSKTIAQGFATNLIRTESGEVYTGFVTNELADRVTLRDQKGLETTIMKDDIEERKNSQISVMPAGVMNDYTVMELASLIEYVESLSQQ